MIFPHGCTAVFRELLGAHKTSSTEQAWTQLRRHIVGLKTEIDTGQRAGIARELGEIVHACYDTAAVYGIYLDDAFNEIHRAHAGLAQDGEIKFDDAGEPVRPRGWKPPTMTRAVAPRNERWPEARGIPRGTEGRR